MRPPDALSCSRLVELVTDYLEGAMAPAERRRFEEHISGCPGCAEYLSQMRQTIVATGRLGEDVPQPVMDALLEAIRDRRPG